MSYCNKHQWGDLDADNTCPYCSGDRIAGFTGTVRHWPHKPSSEQLTFELIQGRKNDEDKPDLSLLPREALEEAAKAFMYGAKKYERYNYLGGMDWHRLVAASLRHITAFNEGEDADQESGVSHLGHALATLSMLLVYTKRGLGRDTRYKKESL